MNVYEALKMFEETNRKVKLSNAAKGLYLELLIILNKNYWKPTKIKTKELRFERKQLASTRRELVALKLISFENNCYKIDEAIASKGEDIASKDEGIASKGEDIASKDDVKSLDKSSSQGFLNNKQINNNIYSNTCSETYKSNKEEAQDERSRRNETFKGRNVGKGEDNGRNAGRLGRERDEKVYAEKLAGDWEVSYEDQLRAWGRRHGYDFEG